MPTHELVCLAHGRFGTVTDCSVNENCEEYVNSDDCYDSRIKVTVHRRHCKQTCNSNTSHLITTQTTNYGLLRNLSHVAKCFQLWHILQSISIHTTNVQKVCRSTQLTMRYVYVYHILSLFNMVPRE